jgi:small subunit ribosomal protein S13
MSSTEFRHLVRIHGKDLSGSKKVIPALSDLRGVGDNLATMMVNRMGLDPKTRVGMLSESQVKEIENALTNPSSLGLPLWAFNRRRDPDSGDTRQLLGSDLDFVLKSDIDREKNVQSWKGIRHSLGLKVRGQRTRTTGRKGRTVGVRKAALAEAAKAARIASDKEKK